VEYLFLLSEKWEKHREAVLRAAVYLLAVAALVYLVHQFRRLVLVHGPAGAVDLKLRYEELRLWLQHLPVYELKRTANYPPASYPILWPFLGWLDLQAARWLWALTSIGFLFWLSRLYPRAGGANDSLERRLMVLVPLASCSLGVTIGNGQLAVHILPALLLGLVLLERNKADWGNDLAVAALFIFALVKPNLSAPFFWIFLFRTGRIRPPVLILSGYLLLTLLGTALNRAEPLSLFQSWIENVTAIVVDVVYFHHDGASIHALLTALGHPELNGPASLLILGGLGAWVFGNRRNDIWLLIGVTALVARFWTYHGYYDDSLILLTMIALFRLAKGSSGGIGLKSAAGLFFGLTLLSILAPGGRRTLPEPLSMVYVFGQTALWLVVLVFLVGVAGRFRKLEQAGPSGGP
jgi:hypothetical protein